MTKRSKALPLTLLVGLLVLAVAAAAATAAVPVAVYRVSQPPEELEVVARAARGVTAAAWAPAARKAAATAQRIVEDDEAEKDLQTSG